MLFIWFYRLRDFIIAVLIAVVGLLTSEFMSKFSLLFIVSVIEIALALISGFHCALLQSVTFTGRLNALDYTKLRG